MALNEQRLRDIIAANEGDPHDIIQMGNWLEPCGTRGCLIGNYCLKHPESELKLFDRGGFRIVGLESNDRIDGMDAVAVFLGIPRIDAIKLFGGGTSGLRSGLLRKLTDYLEWENAGAAQ